MTHNQTIKILILGDKSSGKSCLIKRYIIDDFEDEYVQTVANDFYITESNRNDKQLSVQVWDIVDCNTINKILLKSIHCIVFVIDLTSSNCSNTLELLYNQINASNVPIVVAGSKIDDSIDNEITVNTINDIKLWMKYKKIIINSNLSEDITNEQTNVLTNDLNINTHVNNFIITSAKSNINIDYLFDYIIHLSFNTILSKSNQNILPSTLIDANTNNYISKSPNTNPNQSNSKQETKEEDKIDNPLDSLLKVKVVMVGSSNTGKSSLISKYLNESKDIDSFYQPTIGTDLHVINLTIKEQPLMIQLWDTAGDQSKYNLTKTIYKNADCIVLVYDITSIDSFHQLNNYWDDFFQYNKIIERFDFPVLLVGNKTDLSANRAITLEEVLDWCYKKRPQAPITYMECSSYQNIGIQDLFIYMADAVYEFVAGVDESYIEEEEEELDDDQDNDNDVDDDDDDDDDIEDNEIIEPVDQEVAILLDDSKTSKSNTEKANSRRRSVTSVNRHKVFEPDVERNCWFTVACFPGFV